MDSQEIQKLFCISEPEQPNEGAGAPIGNQQPDAPAPSTAAYAAYQRLCGKPTPKTRSLRDVVAALTRSQGYDCSPDGDTDARGTKLWLLSGEVSKYRRVAAELSLRDANVRVAIVASRQQFVDKFSHFRDPNYGKQQGQPKAQATVNELLNSFG